MDNKLKELRLNKEFNGKKGMTQQEIADVIGVTKRTYIYWEKGERQIKPIKAQKLAEFFGVSVSYLLGYGDELMTFNSGAEFEEYRNNLIKRLNTRERLEKKLGKSTEQYKLDKKTI